MKSYIENREEIDRIIRECAVCRLGLADGDSPYVVPVSFGYDGKSLFIHTGLEGKKIGCFEAGRKVCFEFERNVHMVKDEVDPCRWSFDYECVIGYGTIGELAGREDKVYGLNRIMSQYSGREWDFEGIDLSNTRVWRISIDTVTGKKSSG